MPFEAQSKEGENVEAKYEWMLFIVLATGKRVFVYFSYLYSRDHVKIIQRTFASLHLWKIDHLLFYSKEFWFLDLSEVQKSVREYLNGLDLSPYRHNASIITSFNKQAKQFLLYKENIFLCPPTQSLFLQCIKKVSISNTSFSKI